MTTISVIIPTYNVSEYIEEGLLSVLGQSYAAFEIICVDDGSTDNTVEIIKNIQSRFPNKITLFQNESNRGATYSRNKGLAIAKGEYLDFFDADDIMLPDKFENQVKVIEAQAEHPDILVSDFYRRTTDGAETLYTFKEQDLWCAVMGTALGVTSANLYKRSMILTIKGWDEDLKSSQEYDLMFRILKEGGSVKFDSRPCCIIREREAGSISKTTPGPKWLRYINLRIRIYEYLKEHHLLNEARYSTFVNVMFYSIRILYKYDPKTAVRLHKKYITTNQYLTANTITTQRYLTFYKIFGFRLAEKASKLLNPNPPLVH